MQFPHLFRPFETATKLDGGKGGSCKVLLDLYMPQEELPRLAELRGKRLIVVFADTDQVAQNGGLNLPEIEPIDLGASE